MTHEEHEEEKRYIGMLCAGDRARRDIHQSLVIGLVLPLGIVFVGLLIASAVR